MRTKTQHGSHRIWVHRIKARLKNISITVWMNLKSMTSMLLIGLNPTIIDQKKQILLLSLHLTNHNKKQIYKVSKTKGMLKIMTKIRNISAREVRIQMGCRIKCLALSSEMMKQICSLRAKVMCVVKVKTQEREETMIRSRYQCQRAHSKKKMGNQLKKNRLSSTWMRHKNSKRKKS